jgi:hypothetical protein
MTAYISLKDKKYVLSIGNEQIMLGSQGGLSPENTEQMLELLYKKRENEVVLRPQGGLSPENVDEMLNSLYKIGKPPAKITFTLNE